MQRAPLSRSMMCCAAAAVVSLFGLACGNDPLFVGYENVTLGPRLFGGDLPGVIREEIEFRNRTRDRIEVVGVATSCSCLKAAITPGILEPGKGCLVQVEYRPKNASISMDTVELGVLTRTGVTWRVRVQCFGYRRLEVAPRFLSLGHLPIGSEADATIRLRFRTRPSESGPLKLVSAVAEDGRLYVEDSGWERAGKDGPFTRWERRLGIRLGPVSRPGAHKETLVLTFDRDVQLSRHDVPSRTVAIDVNWNVVPIAAVQPRSLVLNPGDRAVVRIVPMAASQPVRLRTVEVLPAAPGLRVVFARRAMLPASVAVHWEPAPGASDREQVVSVRFRLDHPAQESVALTVLLRRDAQVEQ